MIDVARTRLCSALLIVLSLTSLGKGQSSQISLVSPSPTPALVTASPSPTPTRNQCRIFNSTTDPCGFSGRNYTVYFPYNETLATDRDVFYQSMSILQLVSSVVDNTYCTMRLLRLTCDAIYPPCDIMLRPRAPCQDYCSCVLDTNCKSVWNSITGRIGPLLQNSTNPEFAQLLTLAKMVTAEQNCTGKGLQIFKSVQYSESCQSANETNITCPSLALDIVTIGAIAGGGGALLLCLVVTCCCCLCCCYHRRHSKSNGSFFDPPYLESASTGTILRLAQRGRFQSKFRSPRELLKHVPEVYQPVIEPFCDYLIQESRIQTTSFLAEGNYTEVYQGSIVDLQPYATSVYRTVAVKQFRENVDTNDIKMYLDTCLKISAVSHPNVLKIIGVSFNSLSNVSIVCPHMEEHDLVTYLKKLRSSVLSSTSTQDFTVKRLVDIVVQISHGMRALSRMKIVYKMLSAHTCMVDQQQRVTVGDVSIDKLKFLLQQEQVDGTEFHHHHQKWLAPESIEAGNFSEKSDMWSFGVTACEVLGFGNPPFNDVVDNLLAHLKSEKPLLQPPLCPDSLFNILEDCWKVEPQQRPTFSLLDQTLTSLVTRPSFAEEITAIDKKLRVGEITPTASAPRPSMVALSAATVQHSNTQKQKIKPSRLSSSPTPIQQETATHTSDGYLKVVGTAPVTKGVLEEDYMYVHPKSITEGTHPDTTLTAKDLVEEYDYFSPVGKEDSNTKLTISPPTNSPLAISSPTISPFLQISDWGDQEDEFGYVDVTPKGSPNMKRNFVTHSQLPNTPPLSAKSLKQSHSQGNVAASSRHRSGSAEYYNVPNLKQKDERHLSLPRTKPVPSPKPISLQKTSPGTTNNVSDFAETRQKFTN